MKRLMVKGRRVRAYCACDEQGHFVTRRNGRLPRLVPGAQLCPKCRFYPWTWSEILIESWELPKTKTKTREANEKNEKN